MQVNEAQAQALTTFVGTLLEQTTTQYRAPISMLSLLSHSQRTLLLHSSRGPLRSWPAQTLQQLFEAQVQLHPSSLAAVSSQEHLSYQLLNARANQLARVL